MPYTIHIKDLTTQKATLKICNEIVTEYRRNPDTRLLIDFNSCNFLLPDYAVLLICTFKFLERTGCKVGGNIRIDKKSKIATYLAKMGFFESLRMEFPLEVDTIDDKRAIKMQRYTKQNQIEVLHSILKVLRDNSAMNDNVYASLDYCLNEVLDNVLNHSEENEGWVVAQYFESLNSIRIIVADSGIGVHQSLNTRHNFTEEEAVLKCIESGVTNGKGQGHGLYATSTFVKLNKGWLSVCSGNKKLNVTEAETIVKDVAHWKGTYVYLRINTNIDVDYTAFTSPNYDYKKQIFEDMFE